MPAFWVTWPPLGNGNLNLNLDIEWLLWASTLIYWKSRALLPGAPAEPPGYDPVRDELVRQLLQHKKDLTEEMRRRKTAADRSLSRGSEASDWATEIPVDTSRHPPFVSVWDLTGQARELARWAARYRATLTHWHETFETEAEPVTVEEMEQALRRFLCEAPTLPANALPWLDQQPSPAHRAALFLALLELVRDQEVTVDQPVEFGGIWLEYGCDGFSQLCREVRVRNS